MVVDKPGLPLVALTQVLCPSSRAICFVWCRVLPNQAAVDAEHRVRL